MSKEMQTILCRGAIHCARLTVLLVAIGTSVHADTRADTLADTLIDPTRPHAPTKALSTVRGSEPVSRLTAIFQSNDRRVAVLDGRVVKVGDRIGDSVIQEILLDSVRYARAGRVEIVRLPKQAAAVRSARKDTPRRDAARNDAARNDTGSANSIRQETTP